MITCPVNQTVNTEPSKAYASVSWTDPQVIDNSGQIPTMTCDAESGSQIGIGETEVICEAVDPTGNQATCMFTVKIKGNANCFVKMVSCDGKIVNLCSKQFCTYVSRSRKHKLQKYHMCF